MHKINLLDTVKNFIQNFCAASPHPVLLGLSGGTDSLALFYALLAYQSKHPFIFHIAHIDHGWRSESGFEAEQLSRLAGRYSIPFHLRKLNFGLLQGNIERACRAERLLFFSELCNLHGFQGVLLAHHYDDQVETVLKRVFEGAHWSGLAGLSGETWVDGLRILRPLLKLKKRDLDGYLKENLLTPFEDSTNTDERFLRARMRQTILPWLNRTFGKNIETSLIKLSEDMREINRYFEQKISPLIQGAQTGPFGTYLDISKFPFSSELEIKYLLRCFCKKYGLKLSVEQYSLCSKSLFTGKADQVFECGGKKLHIDRKHLFLLKENRNTKGGWVYEINEKISDKNLDNSSWKSAWKGECRVELPVGSYRVIDRNPGCSSSKSLSKWWVNHRVPACIRHIFPVIYQDSEIVHEFLTGKSFLQKDQEKESIEIVLKYTPVIDN